MRTWNRDSLVIDSRALHELIAETTERWPGLPAIGDWKNCTSYAELNVLSDKLPHHLIDLGVRLSVCFEKSILTIVSMLANLEADGGIVPLDTTAPRLRLLSIIESTQSSIALSSPEPTSYVQGLVKHLVCVSGPILHALPDSNLSIDSGVEPKDVAYIMFASGSTKYDKDWDDDFEVIRVTRIMEDASKAGDPRLIIEWKETYKAVKKR